MHAKHYHSFHHLYKVYFTHIYYDIKCVVSCMMHFDQYTNMKLKVMYVTCTNVGNFLWRLLVLELGG